MRTLRACIARLGGLFDKQRRANDIAAEIESHLALHTADYMRAGMTAEQARRQAVLKLGGVEPAKEAYRDQATTPWLEHLLLDIRFTLRQMRLHRSFAITAVLVLALGICTSTSIFTFVDAALIKPLPYPDPARLVDVAEKSAQFPRSNLSYLDYQDWKKLNKVFQSLDAYTGNGFLLGTPSGVEPTRAGQVSAGLFRTLGVNVLLGRDFTANEEASASHVVVVSYRTWQQRFGARKDIIGSAIRLSGDAYTVIGVLPKTFQFAPLGPAEFWTTINVKGSCELRRSCHNLYGVARLKSGVSVDSALSEMAVIAKQLERQYPDSNRGQSASVLSLSEAIVGAIRPILLVLMSGATLLLLIASVNVASLLLVRSEGRRRELAVRSALGASFSRMLSQFVTESVLLVLGAAALGVLSAIWATQGLKHLIPEDTMAGLPFLAELGLSWRVLACAGVLSLSIAVLFSLTPALHLSLSKMRDGLAEGSRGSAGQAWRRLGSRLVVVELATAMVLLAGAGLFGKSLYRLLHVELGLQQDHVATISVAAPDLQYGKDEQSISLGRGIIRKIESLPGVKSAGLTTVLPVSFNGNTDWIRFVGRPYDGKHIEVNERDVSSGFFATIGAKLIRGRYFTDAEDGSKPKVAVINRMFARKYFPGEDPIGRQLGDTSLTPKSIRTIVGIVEDIKDGALDSDIWPSEYLPFNQNASTYFSVVARTSQRPEQLLPKMRPAIQKLYPDVGASSEATLESLIDGSMSAYLHRSSAWLVSGFALVALLLGVIGLYGVIAYSVSQRTREIGVRMALGAERISVSTLILREAGKLAAVGIVLGLIGSVAAASLARNLLFGVSSWDGETLIAVALVLGLSAMLASFIPAWRAASVNPVEALRTE